MTTIVLADDHHVVRQGLRALLEVETDFSVVGEAADGLEVAGLVERLEPDVLIVDVMMPGLGGLEVTRQVRQRCPTTRVVILSMYEARDWTQPTLEAGASAFLTKGVSAGQLLTAVRRAARA